MRILMIVTSIVSYHRATRAIARAQNAGKDKINFEAPLTSLVWMYLDPVDRRDVRGLASGCWRRSAATCG